MLESSSHHKLSSTSGFQTDRFSGSHYEIKPLSEHLWKNLKQTGILKRLRGCRGGRPRNVISSSSATFLPHLPSLDSSNSSIAVGSEQRIIHNVDANAESVISQVTSPPKKYVNFCLWNAQSIKNKTACFSDYLCEKKIDLAALTETWFNNFDSAVKAECLPDGYKLFDIARKDQRGGGIALVYRNSFVIKVVDTRPHYESFDASDLILTSSQTSRLRLSIIYRPPYSCAHPVCTGTFITEFWNYLESFVLCMEPVVICGDFNIHIDDESDPYSTALTDLLQSMALKQHVCIPTQHHGHTLDLIITRDSDNLITDLPVTDTFLSDHATVLCNLSILKGKPITRDVTFRKLKSIDLEVFTDDLRASELLLDPPTLLTDLVRSYNTTLSSLLDEDAPPCTRAIVSRLSVPWFNEETRSAKRLRRRAERKWKLSNLDADFQAFKTIKNKTTYIMNNARREFYTEFVENNSHDQRKLFCATKKLLNKKSDTALPSYCDKTSLANDMGTYFIKKISDIRAEHDNNCNFTSPVSDDPDDCFDQPSAIFSQFSILDIDAVRKLVTNAPTKTCPLDPLPTVLLKICLDDILPTLANMLNLSMQTGEFPEVWKEALVTPILKREGLDTIFKNYRPISNLQFVSKLVERAVADQLYSFMVENGLLPELQSAYRPGHSTETALLKVKNDLLLNMDGQRVTLLVLLDLSAAFDTIDHDVLHNRLPTDFGIKGTALKWFESYLSNRRQRVSIEGVTSKLFDLDFGVPQGSCLGPLLFLLYSSKLFKIISRHLPSVHAYADDTQLYP